MGIKEAKPGGVSGEPGLTTWSPGLTASCGLTAPSGGLTVYVWIAVLILHSFPYGTMGL
jgi:hypothetical protein